MYVWSVYIHIILAAFWVGGMLFTAAVMVPLSRDKMFENRRGELFRKAGTIFSHISWVVFVFMILTGVTALLGMGFSAGDLVSSWFWESPYGQTLHGKLHVFSLMLIVSGLHDFWLGPKAVDLMDREPESRLTQRYRIASRWVGRFNLLLGLLILWYAVTLVRAPGV